MFMPEEIINTYSGIRTPEGIFVNVDCTPLDKARDIIDHSVDFNWG